MAVMSSLPISMRRRWRGASVCVTLAGLDRWAKEESMAKGQMRNNKESKKPKSDKPKSGVSEYKKSQGATGQSLQPPGKK
jgi:hypothetical protein